MGQSLSQLYVHIVFHTKKNKGVLIREKEEAELYAYMGAIMNDLECTPIIINGTSNHVHIFCILSKNIAMAKLVEDVKRHTSRWIKTKDVYYKDFAWQGGYGCFSVSPSVFEKTKHYILKQKEHHRNKTFEEEYLLFLKEYKIEYKEDYVWDD